MLITAPPLRTPERTSDPEARARVLRVYEAIDAATSDPEERVELRRICARESWCGRFGHVGAHSGDAWLGRRQHARAVARGWLDPERCPEHALGPDPGRWATRGAWGLSAAYSLRHVGEGCQSPEVVDAPEEGAQAALGHLRHLARKNHARTCAARAAWWAGPGIYRRRTPLSKLLTVRRQCGEPRPLELLGALVAETFDPRSYLSAHAVRALESFRP